MRKTISTKNPWQLNTPEEEVMDFVARIRFSPNPPYKYCRKAFIYGSRSKISDSKTKDSDWDIAVPYSLLLREELGLDGWKELPVDPSSYRDHYTKHIFEKTFPLGAKVQIAMKEDYDSFKSIWTNLPASVYEACIWKDSPNYLGRDGVCGLINSLKRIYDEGVLRGLYPSSEDKFLSKVELEKVVKEAEQIPDWFAQPVAVEGGGGGGGRLEPVNF